MEHVTHATYAGNGHVRAARAFGAATFAGSGAMWQVGSTTPCNHVVITDIKLRGRWPEEVAS